MDVFDGFGAEGLAGARGAPGGGGGVTVVEKCEKGAQRRHAQGAQGHVAGMGQEFAQAVAIVAEGARAAPLGGFVEQKAFDGSTKQ